MPRFTTLAGWLSWQRRLHARDVDLGLDRVNVVLQRLGLQQPDFKVITVGGTNGKGSTVAFLSSMLTAADYRTGAYTSPHLLRYNERIRIDGVDVSDALLCAAFATVDVARGDISLSFFEFGTLAALQVFRQADIDIAVLEVGLGGRLDAVNAIAADAAIVTTVAIDHVDWLGSDRESIGFEKAGIFRAARPAICADAEPPKSLLDYAETIGAELHRIGIDFGFERISSTQWQWWGGTKQRLALPLPALQGEYQLANASAALMALYVLRGDLPMTDQAVIKGLLQSRNPGRFQVIPGPVEWVLDISHNPQAAGQLAECLRARPVSGRTVALFGMLADKDVAGVIQKLDAVIDHWYTVPLSGQRGMSAGQLAKQLLTAEVAAEVEICATVGNACRRAQYATKAGDRIVVCGSSYTVAAVLRMDILGGE